MSINFHSLGISDFFDNLEVPVKDESPTPDLHLNSAINLDEIHELIKPGCLKYKPSVSKWLQKDWEQLQRDITIPVQDLQVGILYPMIRAAQPGDETYSMSFPVSKEILRVASEGLNRRGIHIPLSMYKMNIIAGDIVVPKLWHDNFHTLLHAVCTVSEIKRGGSTAIYPDVHVERKCAKFKLTTPYGDHFDIRAYNTLLYGSFCNCHYLGNWECLLLMQDLVGQRLCAYMASSSLNVVSISGTIPCSTLTRVIELGDSILLRNGNESYEIIALYEAMCVGTMLRASQDDVNNPDDFLSNCVNEIEALCTELAVDDDTIRDVEQMMSILHESKPHVLSNLFCLYRIWGHPEVDIYRGMEKVYTVGTAVKFIDATISATVVRQFRKMFITGYFKKHHSYPKLLISEECYIKERITLQLRIHESDPAYNISQFDYIVFDQIWDVPESYDLFHILNDKAVSPTRSELADNIGLGQGTRCGPLRRGIMRWLNGETIRCKEFLHSIDKLGLEDDDLIIGMYEKEREIKVKARMFSLMSEKMRYYVVLTEELIANRVLPYFPEITMKDSLNMLQKKLWSYGGKSGPCVFDTNINVDFAKWCTNMRDDICTGIFSDIDRLFGFSKVISRTHDIFRKSFVYASSGKYVPKVSTAGELLPDPPMSYYNHLGGFEGLRQKGWTIVTVCLLTYIADVLKVRIGLMGQGDNQIIKLSMPIQRWNNYKLTREQQVYEARDILKRFKAEMELTFNLAKLPIKLRETWCSCNLFMYGKSMLLNGEMLSQWIKKILRSYALSNEGNVTVAGVVGTIATNCMAAASSSDAPDILYVLYLILAEWSIVHILQYHPFTRKAILHGTNHKVRMPGKGKQGVMDIRSLQTDILIVSLLTIPSSIGGSITIPLTGFIVRGFPDKASEAYTWVKMLSSVKGTFQYIWRNWYSFVQNPTVEADMLIQSPWSINHWRPRSPHLNTRDIVRDWLFSGIYTKNTTISKIGMILKSFPRKEVARSLLTDPMNPLVSSEIYATFPHVYLDGICRRIENTRTIRGMVLRSGHVKPIFKRLMDMEHNYLLYMYWRSLQEGVVYSQCATGHTQKVRCAGWGRVITGLTTPHPLEVLYELSCSSKSPCKQTNDYIYTLIDSNKSFAPYLGSKIRNKVHSLQDESLRQEPLVSTGAKVARYLNWLGISGNLHKIILSNLTVVCDPDIYDVVVDDDPSGDMYTGSISHRFNPASASDGCFINYLPQIGKSVYMSSDFMPTYGRGKNNYTFHYQAMFCFIQYTACRRTDVRFLHNHVVCQECVVPVIDEVCDIDFIPGVVTSLYTSESIEMIRQTLGCIQTKTQFYRPENDKSFVAKYLEPREVRVNAISEGVYESVSMRVAMTLFFGSRHDDSLIDAEDLQEFPRVYSYKLRRDELLYRTSQKLLLIQAMSSSTYPTKEYMNMLRRKVQDLLINNPVNSYKGLGALCLNRNDSGLRNEMISIVEGSAYPETIIDYLKNIKSSLILTVASLNTPMNGRTGICLIPAQEITPYEHLLLMSMRIALKRQCYKMLMHCLEVRRNGFLITGVSCSHNCISWGIRMTPVCRSSLEKSIKYLPIVNAGRRVQHKRMKDLDYIQMSFQLTTSASDKRPLFTAIHHPSSLSRDYRLITLPTSSIYKWSHILQNIQLRKNVIVLGDGTGGTSFCAACRDPDSTIFPLALLESRSLIPQDTLCILPPLSRGIMNVNPRLLLELPDDIFHPDWKLSFSEEIKSLSPDTTTVILDIELARGNYIAIRRLLEATPPGTHVVMKSYIHELLMPDNYLRGLHCQDFLITPIANIEYGECFISGIVETDWYLDRRLLGVSWTKACTELAQISRDNIEEYMRDVDLKYQSAVNLSVNLSISHIVNLGVMLTKNDILLPREGLLQYLSQYINTHYYFVGEIGSVVGRRQITQLLKEKLERVVKIILQIVYGPGILMHIAHSTLFLAHIMPRNARDSLPQTRIMQGRTQQTLMSKKDQQAAACLGRYRLISGLPVPIFPNDISELYTSGCLGYSGREDFEWTISGTSATDLLE